ncbi:uncharacterized protein BDZ99DRAFT_564841 [Mytilinidion resinicola]|uniref:Uncharacterized protein n=1 Tax=Mytilinidion resinicola TaxID=574789 RepID=A0A6A6Z7F1_9PEZI|nr:uncharacterized protein BDZ99DRAFT_564841 [Mytilinidion resinicola]KAF2817032.1 hypothetical protein BDZ99DRAFT_564841 [Mytilinidion resinicola]
MSTIWETRKLKRPSIALVEEADTLPPKSLTGKEMQVMVTTRCRRKHTFPFFELPRELRDMIYDVVFGDEVDQVSARDKRDDDFNYTQTGVHPRQLKKDAPIGATGFFLPRRGNFRVLEVNRQMRLEFAPLVFQRMLMNLRTLSRMNNDLQLTCSFLKGIGEFGRANIRGKGFRTGWSDPDLSAELSNLLMSCPKLWLVNVKIPERKGLGSSVLKPVYFGRACGLECLRSLFGIITDMSVDTTNAPLKKWLMELQSAKRSAEGDDSSELQKRRKA